MSKKQIQTLGDLDRVKYEDYLKLKPGKNINPPPPDGRCDCCGRHISELKPFGGPGDPLVGDFTGAFLVKGYRSLGSYDEEAEKAFEEAERCYKADGFDRIIDWMIDKYGRKEAIGIDCAVQAPHSVGSSWECRDCIVLDDEEYFEKLEHWSEEKTQSKLVK
jgi:hypothetical protein